MWQAAKPVLAKPHSTQGDDQFEKDSISIVLVEVHSNAPFYCYCNFAMDSDSRTHNSDYPIAIGC